MGLCSHQNYKALVMGFIAKFVTCLGLCQLLLMSHVSACDEYLAGSSAEIQTQAQAIKASLMNKKVGFSVIQRPDVLSDADIESIYSGLAKGWTYSIVNKEIRVVPYASSLLEISKNRSFVLDQLRQVESTLDISLLLKILNLSQWIEAQVYEALSEESLVLDSVELRLSDETQTPAEYLKLATSPHVDGGYLSSLATLKGEGTIYWDQHRAKHQLQNNEILFMTNRSRMKATKVRPTLHQIPPHQPQPRMILIVRFKQK
jgi:hypothetical protein